MSRRASFKQADARRAFQAAVSAGLQPISCTIGPDGSIRVEFADPDGSSKRNPLDRVLRQCRRNVDIRTSRASRTGTESCAGDIERPVSRFTISQIHRTPPGFKEELEACQAGAMLPAGQGRAIPRSVNDLVARYYASADFNSGGEADRRRRRLLIESFRTEFGDDLVANFGFTHIEAILVARSEKQLVGKRIVGGKVAAQNLRKQLRRLFAYACRLEWIPSNPVDAADKVKAPKSAGYHTWTDDEIRQFQDRHPLGTRARLALEIMLWTWQRRGDARLFGPHHIKAGKINYRQGKTGKQLSLPVAPQLMEAIGTMQRVGLHTYLVTEFGKPFSAAGLGNKMRQWCDEAGLPHCTAHGLRKAGARRAALLEAGNQRLKAVGGWSDDSQVARYTAGVEQAALAEITLGRVIQADLANRASGLANSKQEVPENEQ